MFFLLSSPNSGFTGEGVQRKGNVIREKRKKKDY